MRKILIVDDDRIEREVLGHLLADKYVTEFADNGKHAMQKHNEFLPDLVLMDVDMPEMNGFETCRKMRQSGFNLPIIFLSFLKDKQEKLDAYNAGCDDFIGKPYDVHEMLAKLELNLSRIDKEKEYQDNQSQIMEMANRSMTDLSYMGRIIQTLEAFHYCDSFQALSSKIFTLLQEFGLSASHIIFDDGGDAAYVSGCDNKPLEMNLLLSLKGQKRILEFGSNRCAYNWQHTTLLVRNMPEDDVANGQMKDYLGYIMNGLDSAIHGLNMKNNLKEAIHNFKEQNRELKLSIMSVIEDFESSLDSLFQRPDIINSLPVDVEDEVIKMAAESRETADRHFSGGLLIEEQLNHVLDMFNENSQGHEEDEHDSADAVTLF